MSERVETDEGGFATLSARGSTRAPSIVVIPPLGMPAALLTPFSSALAKGLQAITVELPGSGSASGIPAGATTRDLARWLLDVLERRGITRTHLFGISLGGMVAQWAILEDPARFDRLVLASTAARGLDAALDHPVEKIVLGARALLSGDPALEMAKQVIGDHVLEDPAQMARIESAIEDHPRDPEETAWLAAAALRHDARDRVGEIAVPTLVITGADDRLIPPALQSALAEAIPGARQVTIEGAGHDVTVDRPAEVAAAVIEFCR
jgi:3-oxoadipate enol-lactonase